MCALYTCDQVVLQLFPPEEPGVDDDEETDENVFENENNVEVGSNYDSDIDEPFDEEIPSSAEVYVGKNGKIKLSPTPKNMNARVWASPANVIWMVPGPTLYAVGNVRDIKSELALLLPDEVQTTVLEMSNLEGSNVAWHGKGWRRRTSISTSTLF